MTDQLQFEKWHGTGNDFVLASHQAVSGFTDDIGSLAKSMCRQHFGVGADGLILVGKGDKADFRVRMWNPDGTESGMCANGLRCVGAHLVRHGLSDGVRAPAIEMGKSVLKLEFPAPPHWAGKSGTWVQVNMGDAILDRKKIPVGGKGKSPVIDESMVIPGTTHKVEFTAVGMGNPHAVIFVVGLDDVPLAEWGPEIENYKERFPKRVNVEFVQVITRSHVRMRVWERGAGITLSCGSGTAAIQVACHITGRAGDKLRVDVPGGSLQTEFTKDANVLLAGPAVHVFDGYWHG
jgi:diaminopimelate epimerase